MRPRRTLRDFSLQRISDVPFLSLSFSPARNDGSPFKCPIDFKIVLGNYYQIYAWLQTGQIDGAIVTPLTESLLKAASITDPNADPDAEYIGLAEFSIYPSQGSQGPPIGYPPIVKASLRGTPCDNPHEVFRDFLLAALKAALKDASSNYADIPAALADVDVGKPDDYHLACVSHLSTSGFMAPALFADLWLRGRLTRKDLGGVDPYRGVKIKRITDDPLFVRNVATFFWERFYASIHFHITHGGPAEEDHSGFKELSFSWDLERKELEDCAGKWRAYPECH